MGSLMTSGRSAERPNPTLYERARAARAADMPPSLAVLLNPPAAGAGTSAVGSMTAAAQGAAPVAAPPSATGPGVVAFPVSPTVLGTLGETGAAGGTASTAPTSRRRRAPSRGRNATLLSGSETAETLGA